MKKFLSHIIVLLFYSLLTIVLTYPQIRHMKQGVYVLSDQLFYAWMIERNVESLMTKPLNEFYNATIFYPYENTLSFGDHLLGETLLALPFYLTTQNPIFAENVLLLASFVLSAYGTFLLVRHFTNNTLVAVVGGVLFSFSHVRFNQYDHLNIISTQWLPFIFLFLQKYLEKWKLRDLVILSVFYLLTILLTVYYLVMVSLAIGVYVLGWIVLTRTSIKKKLKELGFLVTSLGGCIVLVFPTMMPYFTFARKFPDVKRVIGDNIIYSANIMSYFMAARTTVASRVAALSDLSESDAGLFPGVVVLTFVSIGVVVGLRKNTMKLQILFLGIMATVFALLSFGPFLKFTDRIVTSLAMPYYYIYYILFPLSIMRVPARFAIFSELFLVVLACFGLYLLLKEFIKPKMHKFVILAVLLVGIIETWSVPLPLILVETKQDFPQVYYWLKEQPEDTVVLELPIPNNSLKNPVKQTYRHAFMENLSIKDRDNVEAYRNYFSLLHGKRTVNGYSAFAPPLYIEAVENTGSFPGLSSIEEIQKMDVDYVIIHTKQYFPEVREKIENMLENEKNLEVVVRFNDDIVVKIP